jgi:hypothetical protein
MSPADLILLLMLLQPPMPPAIHYPPPRYWQHCTRPGQEAVA